MAVCLIECFDCVYFFARHKQRHEDNGARLEIG